MQIKKESSANSQIIIPVISSTQQSSLDVFSSSAMQKLVAPKSSRRTPNIITNISQKSSTKKVQQQQMTVLKSRMKKLTDIIISFTETTRAPIIEDSKLLNHLDRLNKQFDLFFIQADKYFRLSETDPNALDPTNFINVKTMTLDFLQKWKEFMFILKQIDTGFVPSISEYIRIKFLSIEGIINEIASKKRQNSVHDTKLQQATGTLKSLISNLSESFQSLFIDSDIHSLSQDTMPTRINEVKAFLRVYNNAHYREFPKSAASSVDLAQYHSFVVAAANSIISSIRNAFAFGDTMDMIRHEVEEIHEHLQLIFQKLNLSTTAIREEAKASNIDRQVPKKAKPDIAKFVDGFDHDIVQSAKLEEYIEKVSKMMELDLDDDLDCWSRLEQLQNAYFQKVAIIKEQNNQYAQMQKKMQEQTEEMITMMKNSESRNIKHSREVADLNQKIKGLQNAYDQQLKKIEQLERECFEKSQAIEEMKDEKDQANREAAMARMASKMTKMMTEYPDPEDEVDKMNVIILERRCSKCKEYEALSKQIKSMLKGVVDFERGETVIQVVDRLNKEITNLREDNLKYKQDAMKQRADMQELTECIEWMTSSITPTEFKGKEVTEITKESRVSFLEFQKQQEIDKNEIRTKLHIKHSEQLASISKALDPMVDELIEGSSKESILKKVELIQNRLEMAEKDSKFCHDVLHKVEIWMNEKSHFVTEGIPIDHALNMMMEAIDTMPNPLEHKIDELRTEMGIMKGCLAETTKQLRQIAKQEEKNYQKLGIYELVNLMTSAAEELTSQIETTKCSNEDMKNQLDQVKGGLIQIKHDISTLIGQEDEENTNEMTVLQLMISCMNFTNELCNPKGAKYFMAVSQLNNITMPARKIMKIADEKDPVIYMPQFVDFFSRYSKSFKIFNSFKEKLQLIFKTSDFSKESLTPGSKAFTSVRELLFEMHGQLSQLEKKSVSGTDTMHVLNSFIALSSSLLSGAAQVAQAYQ